jgi:hypothetical protein
VPITTTQQGTIAQWEIMKLLMLGSDGELEVTAPVTDDERRDMETHIRGQFGHSLVFQAKSTTRVEHRWKARTLDIFFPVAKDRLISHPLFWYFFGYLDLIAMGFGEPVFVVPSDEVHKHASPHLERDIWRFKFAASLEPDSRDHWRNYQVSTREVGRHVLDLLKTLPEKLKVSPSEAASFTAPTDILWVKSA